MELLERIIGVLMDQPTWWYWFVAGLLPAAILVAWYAWKDPHR
jgi:hypothetical protein